MYKRQGYNWTVVPVERRKEYMKALEKASVEGDIPLGGLDAAVLRGLQGLHVPAGDGKINPDIDTPEVTQTTQRPSSSSTAAQVKVIAAVALSLIHI